ncbi:hypothetical protein [Phocaeicola plebeius]|jgi:hypothetical protein|uniref:hypothetical protein n=1 Tax=Phocaeicola plebeius TaxID=310297 RepID=UPI0026EDB23F|nr:hypothetical protein [Phocaeicola plebeius]
MKKFFLMIAVFFTAAFSYGQTFVLKSITSPKGNQIATIETMLDEPEIFDLSAKDIEKIRKLQSCVIKLKDTDEGLEILSCNISNFPIRGGMVFYEDSEKEDHFLYRNDDGDIMFDITLKTTFGYYRGFTLGIYKDEAFWWFNKDIKKQGAFLFERK